jgi:hypothetical protein
MMTRIASSRTFALVGAFLLLSACGKDKPKPEETKQAEPTPVPSGMVFNDFLPQTGGNSTGLGVRGGGADGGLAGVAGDATGEAQGAAQADGSGVKVVEAGADPKALRKYSFAANSVDRRVITVTQSVSQSAGGQTSPPQEISLKLSVELTVKQSKPAGALIEVKITKVELPGAPPQAAPMLAQMNGLSGTFEVSSSGEVGELAFANTVQMRNQLAETVLQGLSQSTQLLYSPLPTIPVGVGARWDLAGKGEGDQGTKHFTLKEATGDSAVVESEIQMKVPRRATQSPRGGSMFVTVDGGGKFTQTIRFGHAATKSEGELSIKETIEVADPRGGGTQTIVQVQKSKHLVETASK